VVILIGIYLGNRPADEDHPYGHEKIESIAGVIIGVVLVITAYSIVADGVMRLYKGEIADIPEKITLVIAGISIVVKYILYLYKMKIGKRTNNDAVIADAREHRSDSISSLGVLVGIGLSILVHPSFDIILSIIVGFIIGKEGIEIILETSDSILDKQDKELIEEVKSYVTKFEDAKNVHDIYMRKSGSKIFLTFHMRVDKDMTIHQGHELADSISFGIKNDFEEVYDVMIHLDCAY